MLYGLIKMDINFKIIFLMESNTIFIILYLEQNVEKGSNRI